MASGTVQFAGIPIPSTDPVFLAIVGVHILVGIAAVLSGAGAMLSRKGSSRHVRFGQIYFWSLAAVFVTMSALSIIRWAEDRHLFVLGALSFGTAFAARQLIRRRRLRLHLAGMGASYVFMLTAFYVDNGRNLPLWRELPTFAYWIVPAAIGIPLIVYYTARLPRIEWRVIAERTGRRPTSRRTLRHARPCRR
jgi:uncharacterized membrane protein